MKVFEENRGRGPLTRKEALDCMPVKNHQVKEARLETGEILLTYPTTIRPWIGALSKFFGKAPGVPRTKKLQLDLLGTFVWNLMDGNRSVSQMILDFSETHRLRTREVEIAVTRFIKELGKRGLIGLRIDN